jgi:hypothetical protein
MTRNRKHLSTATTAVLVLLSAGLVLTPGCSKPPPPPPKVEEAPPPPPPPKEVALDTIGQELKADPRIQYADGVVVTEDRMELGRAVVKLADALAKGDDKALEPLLTRRAQGVLSELKNSGAWEDATKKIEGVRVIAIRDNVNLSGVGQVKVSGSELITAAKGFLATLPADQRSNLEAQLDSLANSSDPVQALKDMIEQQIGNLQAAGVDQSVIDQIKAGISEMSGGDASVNTGTAVLLAVQEANNAYLLAWGAEQNGDGWIFNNAPSSPQSRARAAMFDGIGQEAFQEVTLAANVTEAPLAPASSGKDGSPGADGASPPSGEPGTPPAAPPSPPHNPRKPTVPGSPGGG